MKSEQQITNLLKSIQNRKGLSPFHISLYTAMLSSWKEQAYKTPFRITRKELMILSGIRSFATYHKCLKELINWHYIYYEPSFDKNTASKITLLTSNDTA
jgi:hypothetical protein